MDVQIIEKKERYVACPECGDESSHRITHVSQSTTFGPFFCRSCGAGIVGHLTKDGQAEIRVIDERRIPTYVLLRLAQPGEAVYLVVRDVICESVKKGSEDGAEEPSESLDFLYGNQISPRVYVANSVALMREGDEESYGLFEYVTSAPAWHGSVPDGAEEEVVFQIFEQQLGLKINNGESGIILKFPGSRSKV